MNWYLLQTKPNAHFTADENLRRQGFNVFLPLIKKTSKKSGKFVEITTPLFPGYLFISTSVKPIPWNSINGTRGISKAVTLDGKYRPLNIQIVEGLKSRCDNNGIFQNMKYVIAGDRVKIERGPFANFICNIDSIEDSKRVWVLIDLLHKQTRVKISLSNLSKVN